MKKKFPKILLLILILGITFSLAYIGMKSEKVDNFIDLSYQVFMVIMFFFLIVMYCFNILPKDLKKIKIKKIMSKKDYNALESFITTKSPEDKDLEFETFCDTVSAATDIIYLQKEDLCFITPLEFTASEREAISKYRNQNTEEAKQICSYYDKCLEIIDIINKYYDSTGKLKNN